MTSRMRALFLCCALTACMALCLAGCTTSTSQTPETPATEFSDTSDTSAPDSTDTSSNTSTPSATTSPDDEVAKTVASLSLEQKVAQMFIVTPESITGVDTATQAGDTTKQALQNYPVGGIVYFEKNLLNADQTSTMISNSQQYAQDACGLPLFIGVDEEGGTVSRIGGNPGFDIANVGNMSDIGATGDTDKAKSTATTIGTYLKQLGFNLNFAPDSDICGDPSTDVMALRSFGTDPNAVASMVSAQVEGFTDAGILCTAKHFPGIGGVMGDSHEGAITTQKTLDELRSFELVPFKAAISAGVPFIMVGHLSTPNATGDSTPASINSAIITDLLRNELGYQNIIITDSMSMGALDGFTTSDQAGVAAIQAGADIVLMPDDFAAAYQGVIDAVNNGTISQDRIDESVTRIVKAKQQLK